MEVTPHTDRYLPTTHTPSYVRKRGNVYYYRYRVPVDLVAFYSKKELVASLHTNTQTIALSMAAFIQNDVERMNVLIRKYALNAQNLSSVTQEIHTNLLNQLSESISTVLNPENGRFTTIRLTHTSKFDPDSNVVSQELNVELKPLHSIVEPTATSIPQVSDKKARNQTATETIPIAKSNKDTLTNAIEKFTFKKKGANRIGKKGLDAIIYSIDLFFAALPTGVQLDQITSHDVEVVRDKLKAYPVNCTKKKVYAEETFDQKLKIAAANRDKCLSPSRINDIMRHCKQFFRWLLNNNYISNDPFIDFNQIVIEERDDEMRPRWDSTSLDTLLSDNIFSSNTFRPQHDYQYWLPLLALFTGARLTELAQLTPSDVFQDNCGSWVISINKNHGHKRLKNRYSKRIVPIHSSILNLGFTNFVSSRSKEQWLFAGLVCGKGANFGNPPRDGMGHYASKYFVRLFNKLDIELCFHGFRHTFVDEMKQQGADEIVTAQIIGHSWGKAITYKTYGKKSKPQILLAEMQHLTFPKVDELPRKW